MVVAFGLAILGQAGQEFAAGPVGGGFLCRRRGRRSWRLRCRASRLTSWPAVLALEGQELWQELGRRVVLGLELFGFFAA